MGAHCRGLSFQALVAPRVLQTEEFSQIWRTRMATLARLPRILDDIPQMDADRKGVTWDILLTDRVVVATDRWRARNHSPQAHGLGRGPPRGSTTWHQAVPD